MGVADKKGSPGCAVYIGRVPVLRRANVAQTHAKERVAADLDLLLALLSPTISSCALPTLRRPSWRILPLDSSMPSRHKRSSREPFSYLPQRLDEFLLPALKIVHERWTEEPDYVVGKLSLFDADKNWQAIEDSEETDPGYLRRQQVTMQTKWKGLLKDTALEGKPGDPRLVCDPWQAYRLTLMALLEQAEVASSFLATDPGLPELARGVWIYIAHQLPLRAWQGLDDATTFLNFLLLLDAEAKFKSATHLFAEILLEELVLGCHQAICQIDRNWRFHDPDDWNEMRLRMLALPPSTPTPWTPPAATPSPPPFPNLPISTEPYAPYPGLPVTTIRQKALKRRTSPPASPQAKRHQSLNDTASAVPPSSATVATKSSTSKAPATHTAPALFTFDASGRPSITPQMGAQLKALADLMKGSMHRLSSGATAAVPPNPSTSSTPRQELVKKPKTATDPRLRNLPQREGTSESPTTRQPANPDTRPHVSEFSNTQSVLHIRSVLLPLSDTRPPSF